MALLNILTEGEETLRKTCRPVEKVTERIRTLLDDMYETMLHAEGVGLAGPQVGVLRRVVVVETEPGNPIELINPVIVEMSGEQEGTEGCLSLPGKSGCVRRPMNVTVKALDRNGQEFTVSGTALTARAFCHEIDHLDGILYTDKALYMNAPDDDAYADEDNPRRSVRRHRFGKKD